MRKAWMAAALGIVTAAMAHAAEFGGVNIAAKVSVGGQELVLNGAGIRTRLFVKVYVGSLYVPAKATTLASVLDREPRRIQMNVMRSLSPDQLIGALTDGIKDNNSAAEQAAVRPQVDQLVAIMRAFNEVKEKDVVTLDFVDGATHVGLNRVAKGTIPGAAFNGALTRIWLGDNPAQPDLKRAMLGG